MEILYDIFSDLGFPIYFTLVAFPLSIIAFKKVSSYDRIIPVIVWIHLCADLIGNFFINQGLKNVHVYHVSTGIALPLTILAYGNSALFKNKARHGLIITSVVVLYLIGFALTRPDRYNFSGYVMAAFIIVITSYLVLRKRIILDQFTTDIGSFFVLANLIYFAMMTSATSAIPFLSENFSDRIGASAKIVNDVGYSIWSLLLSFGFLWTVRPD